MGSCPLLVICHSGIYAAQARLYSIYLQPTRDRANERRGPLSSQHQPSPFLPACYLMPPRCASQHSTSMPPAQITLRVRSIQTSVPCPLCTTTRAAYPQSLRTHPRRPPLGGYRVRLQLRVRKWFCRNRHCRRRIFTERLPTVAAPGPCTLRLAQQLVALGMALGGAARGASGPRNGLAMSRNTLLRGLRRMPLPVFSTPPGAGGRRFRPAETAYLWHDPGGSRTSAARSAAPGADRRDRWRSGSGAPGRGGDRRDRASAYAEGARHGAPDATQVADRFHLLQNLADPHPRVHDAWPGARRCQHRGGPAARAAARWDRAVSVPPPPTPPAEEARATQRAAHRQARYDAVWALHRQGWSTTAIAAQVGCSCRTIERYLQMPTWPVRQHRRHYGRSIVNPYKAYLLERWNAGCHTAIQLFQEIQARGYAGSYRRVTAYVSRIRQAQGIPPRRQARRQRLPVVAEPVVPALDAAPGDLAGAAAWRRSAPRPRSSRFTQLMRSRPQSPRPSTSRRFLPSSSPAPA